jgi:3-hydroxyisobutyrate dehydrogenase-like beta-hydroxyacid dehydrogenase
VGLLGLGNMGAAIAHRLVPRFEVTGYDPDPRRQAEASAAGVDVATSVRAVADAAPIAVLSLPTPAISLECTAQLVDAWRTPGAIVETSTVTPTDARRAATVCATTGSQFVEAAILSGVKPVMEGTTSLLIGGSPDAVVRVSRVLDAITSNQRLLGDVGAGMAMKVINNAVAHAVYVVLSEALAMAETNGISLPVFTEILSGPDAGLMRPLTHRIAERVATGDFEGGMSVDAARKDSKLALELAQASGLPLYATQAAHTVYEIAVAEGMGRLDYAAIATLWSRWMRADGSVRADS